MNVHVSLYKWRTCLGLMGQWIWLCIQTVAGVTDSVCVWMLHSFRLWWLCVVTERLCWLETYAWFFLAFLEVPAVAPECLTFICLDAEPEEINGLH